MSVLIKFFLPVLILGVIYSSFTNSLYAQCVDQSGAGAVPRAVNGLISAQSQDTANSKFGNDLNSCVNNNEAALPAFQIPTFAELKSIFYDQFKPNSISTKNILPPSYYDVNDSVVTNAIKTYPYSTTYIPHNLTIDYGIDANQTGVGVFFVGGNLIINHDIYYHPNDLNGGLVFVVNGDVTIDKAVNQIDAVIITTGTICTYNDTTTFPTCPVGTLSKPDVTNQLVINGSLISLNSKKPIIFRRKLFDNNTPAEVVNQQPKYLVLLQSLFSQTLSITTEDTDFAEGIGTAPGPPSLAVSCSTAPNPAVPDQTVTWTANPVGGTPPYKNFAWSGDPSINGKSGSSSSVTASYGSTGTYSGSVKVTDSNNKTASGSCSANVQPAPPPQLTSPQCSVSPDNPPGGTTSTKFTWSASVSGGTPPYTYAWGGAAPLSSQPNINSSSTSVSAASFSYPANGDYNGSVTITDSKSQTTGSIACSNVAHVAPPPPTITFSNSPARPTHSTSETVNFTNSGPTTGDWVGYCSNSLGCSQSVAVVWFYTNSCTTTSNGTTKGSGSCSFTIPSGDAGKARYFQYFDGNNQSLYVSNPFFVQ